jgi:WD40 repeat protein
LYGWDLRQMKELWRTQVDTVDVAMSADGTRVAVKTFGALLLLDAATGEELGAVDHAELVYALAFSPDGDRLAIAVPHEADICSDVMVYRIVERTPHHVIPSPSTLVTTGHAGNVTAVAFSADGRVLVTGGADGTVELHEL